MSDDGDSDLSFESDNGHEEDNGDSDPESTANDVPGVTLQFFDNPEINEYALDFLNVFATAALSKEQATRMWELNKRHDKRFHPSEWKTFKSLLRKARKVLPTIVQSWRVVDKVTDTEHTGSGPKFPERLYHDKNRYALLEMWSRIPLNEMMRFHAQLHPEKRHQFYVNGKLQPSRMPFVFTSDGLPCGNSTSSSLHVIAIRFDDCKTIYFLETRVARRKVEKHLTDFLDPFVDQVVQLTAQAKKFLGDAPMRSFFKKLKGHAGYHSCEVCLAPGANVGRRVCYPACTVGYPQRNMANWMESVAEVEEGIVDESNGIVGRSPLLRLPNFDVINDCPSDPLHRDFLGITKNLWRLLVDPNKHGAPSARAQAFAKTVSSVYMSVRLPREFSHRSRSVDHANFKGHEWKSLLMTVFHTMATAGQEMRGGHIGRIITLYTFLTKIYLGPETHMEQVGKETLKAMHETLYDMYEEEFGQAACSFNWHSYCHMYEIRQMGRQSYTSTEPFESAYGKVKLSFEPGTSGIGIQILERMMLRTLRTGYHNCKITLKMGTFDRETRHDDSILVDDNWNFYKIRDQTDTHVTVVDIKKVKWTSDFDPTLPFDLVGVFRFNGYGSVRRHMRKSFFTGKGVMVEQRILMGLSWDLLFS